MANLENDAGLMAGFFPASQRKPQFINLLPSPVPIPYPSLKLLISDTKIVSSSSGLVLMQDARGFLEILNPFLPSPDKLAKRSLPKPPRVSSEDFIVLAVDRDLNHNPLFYVVSPTFITSSNSYQFTTFTSGDGQWHISPPFNLGMIIPSTGVSCERFSYWLTQKNEMVEYNGSTLYARLIPLPGPCKEAPTKYMQLGKVLPERRLALVRVSKKTVELYLLQKDDDWEKIKQEEESDGGSAITCQELPLPLRFESPQIEVPLWVNGRFVVWEIKMNNGKWQGSTLRKIQLSKPLESLEGAVICMFSKLKPGEFGHACLCNDCLGL